MPHGALSACWTWNEAPSPARRFPTGGTAGWQPMPVRPVGRLTEADHCPAANVLALVQTSLEGELRITNHAQRRVFQGARTAWPEIHGVGLEGHDP
jgi:hypothetical protein